jgi:L-asparaginase II
MSDLRIEATRGGIVESVHVVSVAVVDPAGRLVAHAGEPARVSFWRSAAKPFQALPLLEDGAADALGLTPAELALACASHSSEPKHLAVAEGFLRRIGATVHDLACGAHQPLSAAVAERVLRERITLTPLWSNCSGKHAGMLALARHHGWPAAGYNRPDHPVQRRILAEVSRWTELPATTIRQATDGCAAVTFGLPLTAMAGAWARFGAAAEPGAARLRTAMTAHPDLVAGTGRLCTELMAAWPGRVLAKVGAAGVYCAALPGLELGIALKVADGDSAAAAPALLAVMRALLGHAGVEPGYDFTPVESHAKRPIVNTRGTTVGAVRAAGALRFRD